MKRGWIILLLSFVLTHCFASEINIGYQPMLSEGKVWTYTHLTPHGKEQITLEVRGDTVINNQKCYKLFLNTPNHSWLYGCYYEKDPSSRNPQDHYHSYFDSALSEYNAVWAYLYLDIQVGDNGELNISQKHADEPTALYCFMGNRFNPPLAGMDAPLYLASIGGCIYIHSSNSQIVKVFNYDLIKCRSKIFAKVSLTTQPVNNASTDEETTVTWVSGVGDSKWGIMNPKYGPDPSLNDWLKFESCYVNGDCLFTIEDLETPPIQPAYHPFVEDNKVWAYDKNPKGAKDYRFYMRGDTIIGGRKCLKMYSENEYNDGKVNYKGAYYEKNRQVFRYWPGEENALIQYDFSLGLGETVLQASLGTKVDSGGVQSFANIMVMDGGVPYRVLAIYEVVKWANREKIEVTDDTFTGAWIEGVGPAFMLDVGYLSGFGAIGGRWGNGIQYCSVNGNVFYRSPWYKGQTDIHQPVFETTERARDTDYTYDLSGRHLESAPASGLYIRNGKKYVVK